MGQKVNPIGLRLGINRTWDSRWYAGKREYGKLLQEDIKIREYLSDKLKAAGVSRIIHAAKLTRMSCAQAKCAASPAQRVRKSPSQAGVSAKQHHCPMVEVHEWSRRLVVEVDRLNAEVGNI